MAAERSSTDWRALATAGSWRMAGRNQLLWADRRAAKKRGAARRWSILVNNTVPIRANTAGMRRDVVRLSLENKFSRSIRFLRTSADKTVRRNARRKIAFLQVLSQVLSQGRVHCPIASCFQEPNSYPPDFYRSFSSHLFPSYRRLRPHSSLPGTCLGRWQTRKCRGGYRRQCA
jgi:hypothetical protein